jgi:hypothetical protein
MGYKLFFVVFMMLICSAAAAAQEVTMVGGQRVRIEINPDNPNPQLVQAKLTDVNSYQFFEAADLAQLPLEIAAINSLGDAAEKQRRLRELGDRLRAANLIDMSVPPACELQCTRIELALKRPYKFDTAYVVTVAGVDIKADPPAISTDSSRVDLKLTNKAAILPSVDAAKSREEIRVVAAVPLRYNSTIVVRSKRLKLSPDGAKTEVSYDQLSTLGAVTGNSPPNELTMKLDKKLEESRSHLLEIRNVTEPDGNVLPGGLYDRAGREIAASGKFDVPGLPAPPDNPKFDLKLTGDAAVHQKPNLDLKANFAPVPFPRSNTSQWTWEPTASLEIGLSSLKSTNSIILDPLRFARYLNLCRYEERDERTGKIEVENRCKSPDFPAQQLRDGEVETRVYHQWANAPWTRLSFIKFGVSPFKVEADREFSRINTVAGARFDFMFSRLLWSIQDQRMLLGAENKITKDDLALIELNRGFRIVPYLVLDFGGHVTTEKIEKDLTVGGVKQTQTVFVPKHGVARGRLGTTALFQWRMLSLPMSLTLDEHLIYLALEETVGFTNDSGAFLKRLRGFHHRGTASWDVYLDPAKHYSFNVSYENGRKAPNFEYLNKVTTGIKVVY